MKRFIDFQLFDEQGALQIPGIDADILKELEAELPVAEEPAVEEVEEQATEVEATEPEAVPEDEQGRKLKKPHPLMLTVITNK